MSERGNKLVSIVCPVYNEIDCVNLFFDRLTEVLTPLRDRYDFELIFTNNDSHDGTYEAILALRADHPWIKIVTLSRNFGYQASVTCGLRNATGAAMIIIDADCEDPPEMIETFLSEWEAGCDVVHGIRLSRSEGAVMRLMRRVFYRLTRQIADNEFLLDTAEFSLISAAVRDQVVRNRSSYPFVRNEIAYAGFRRKGIPYTRQQRVGGTTNFNLYRILQFAFAGILTASTFPLRLILYVGVPAFAIDVVAAALVAFGFTVSVDALVLLNLAFLIMSAVVIALYTARIYKDGVGRPLFIVDPARTALDRAAVDHTGGEVVTPSERAAQ